MITKEDIETIEAIKKDIDKRAMKDRGEIWSPHSVETQQIETISRMVRNLQIAEHSYRPATQEDLDDDYFTADCKHCDWWGSSRLLEGGGPIADSGDYDDAYCPVCGSTDIDEK